MWILLCVHFVHKLLKIWTTFFSFVHFHLTFGVTYIVGWGILLFSIFNLSWISSSTRVIVCGGKGCENSGTWFAMRYIGVSSYNRIKWYSRMLFLIQQLLCLILNTYIGYGSSSRDLHLLVLHFLTITIALCNFHLFVFFGGSVCSSLCIL